MSPAFLSARCARQGSVEGPDMWNQVLDKALREPSCRWESEGIGFMFAKDYRKALKVRRGSSGDAVKDEGRVLRHFCSADDLYAMEGTMNHLTRILEDMTNAIERLGMRWKEKSLPIVAGRFTEYKPGDVVEIISNSGERWIWRVVEGVEALGTWLDNLGCSEASMWHRISKANSMFYAKKALFCDPKLPVKRRIDAFHSTCAPAALLGAGEWAYTQSMFQALRIQALGTLRRVLCLRTRRNECWADHMKRTGVIVARQLKKHNQPRVQTLALRRVRIAAWQMVSCPSDAKGRRYWEESVTWRCDEMLRDKNIKLSKEDYRNSTRWKRPLPGRPNYLERLFTRFLGDAWIPKLKACNTWTEWLSLTKEFEHSWHVMLNLKPPEASSVCDFPVERSKRPRDDSDPGMLHGHQIHIVVWRFMGTTRLLSTGSMVLGKSRAMSMLFLCVVWWINLCGGSWVVLSGRELMKMTGAGISFASRSKLRTHMLIGSWILVILDLERNGWRLISTIKCKNHVILCCHSMVPEGRADLVRLLGYCAYRMNSFFLRKSPMVDVC